MNATHLRSPAHADESNAAPVEADRWLEAMGRVCSHDLPNQLVALQSLLTLLAQEQSARLDGEGREFLARMQNALRHAGSMARFLKEMANLRKRTARLEPIALAGLARELQGGLQHLFPERQFTFAWNWNVPSVVGDATLMTRAILELCAGLSRAGTVQCAVSASSREAPDTIELAFHLDEHPASGAGNIAKRRTVLERMEVVLAREWLALMGVGLEGLVSGEAEARFVLTVPNR